MHFLQYFCMDLDLYIVSGVPYRKANLRALKLLQLAENQQKLALDQRFRAQRDQLDRQFDQKSQVNKKGPTSSML